VTRSAGVKENLEISSVRCLNLSYQWEQPHSSCNSNSCLSILSSQLCSCRHAAAGLKKSWSWALSKSIWRAKSAWSLESSGTNCFYRGKSAKLAVYDVLVLPNCHTVLNNTLNQIWSKYVKQLRIRWDSSTACAVPLHKAYVLLNAIHDFMVCLDKNFESQNLAFITYVTA